MAAGCIHRCPKPCKCIGVSLAVVRLLFFAFVPPFVEGRETERDAERDEESEAERETKREKQIERGR